MDTDKHFLEKLVKEAWHRVHTAGALTIDGYLYPGMKEPEYAIHVSSFAPAIPYSEDHYEGVIGFPRHGRMEFNHFARRESWEVHGRLCNESPNQANILFGDGFLTIREYVPELREISSGLSLFGIQLRKPRYAEVRRKIERHEPAYSKRNLSGALDDKPTRESDGNERLRSAILFLPDCRFDPRLSVYTGYAVTLLDSNYRRLRELMEKDPSILLRLYERAFPWHRMKEASEGCPPFPTIERYRVLDLANF